MTERGTEPLEYDEVLEPERARRASTSRADQSTGGRRKATRKAKRRPTGCLPVLIVLVILGGLGWYGVSKGMGYLDGVFGDPDDFAGPGAGRVLFQVHEGDTLTDMGDNLADDGVVASSEAFTDAAADEPSSTGIQVGYYQLKKEMKASDVVDVMVDPKNLVSDTVTIPEGSRVAEVIAAIAKSTDFKSGELTDLLDHPDRIGLPKEADGNPEGYLYPATYPVTPDMSARDLLSEMVDKAAATEKALDVDQGAADLGLDAHQVLTVASILEYEGNNPEDFAKIARVIYNRLDDKMKLQLDSTVSYLSPNGSVWTSEEERANPSAYNTYQNEGLPPGPIGSPGEDAIKAALNPADGDWLFFVPDYENDTTLFADTYAEHQRNVAKLQEYCRSPNTPEC